MRPPASFSSLSRASFPQHTSQIANLIVAFRCLSAFGHLSGVSCAIISFSYRFFWFSTRLKSSITILLEYNTNTPPSSITEHQWHITGIITPIAVSVVMTLVKVCLTRCPGAKQWFLVQDAFLVLYEFVVLTSNGHHNSRHTQTRL